MAPPAAGIAAIEYGPDLATEADLRLLHAPARSRVLDLGSGEGDAAIAFARDGAFVIAVDPDDGAVARSRARAAEAEVKVEFRSGDLADLAFLRAESIDLAFSAWALGAIDDIDRVFRQVHRVLKAGSPFVFSCPHPLALCVGRDDTGGGALPLGRLEIRRPYGALDPVKGESGGGSTKVFPRTIGALFAALRRAGFATEQIHEVAPARSADPGPEYPTGLVWKARKEGS
jgi:SAM-dependent methyltransferase